MDKIEKLFRKLGQKERSFILDIVERLVAGNKAGLNIKKVEGTDFFRAKKGRIRIIFHYEQRNPVIDSIKLRNERTYK